MRSQHRSSFVLAPLIVLSLLAAACGDAVGNPGVALSVAGNEVSVAQVEERLEQLTGSVGFRTQLQQGGDRAALTAEATSNTINQLVIAGLLEQGLEELDLPAVTDEDVQERLVEIADEQFGGQEGFQSFLEQQGITDEEAFDQIRLITIQERIQEALGEDIVVEEADVQEVYAAQFAQPTVSHILVATEEEAQAVLDRLADGEVFELLAQELSIDPGSGAQGGLLGPFVPGQFVPEFEDGYLALEPGEVSEPVETQFGFHIIRANDPPVLDDALYAQIEGQLRNQQGEQVINDFFNELFFSTEVVVNPRFGSWDPLQQAVVPTSPLGDLRPVQGAPGGAAPILEQPGQAPLPEQDG